MNMNLFFELIFWLLFVGSTGVILLINYIWYIKFDAHWRQIADRKLGLPIIVFVVSGIWLLVYYFGGTPPDAPLWS